VEENLKDEAEVKGGWEGSERQMEDIGPGGMEQTDGMN